MMMMPGPDPASSADGAWNLRRVRVFLAEDDAALRHLIATVLRADGYEVIEAEDGPELLDRLASTLLDDAPLDPPDTDVIVTDVRMPGVSGLDVLLGLRRAQWRTPVIVMTAHADPAMQRRARRLGAAAFLAKPIELDHLRAAVARVAPLD